MDTLGSLAVCLALVIPFSSFHDLLSYATISQSLPTLLSKSICSGLSTIVSGITIFFGSYIAILCSVLRNVCVS